MSSDAAKPVTHMAVVQTGGVNMMTFPAVEACRAELRQAGHQRLGDAELAGVRRCCAEAHQSTAIEGVHPYGEQAAFYAMLLDMQVPQGLASSCSGRFLRERIVGPALARQEAAAAE